MPWAARKRVPQPDMVTAAFNFEEVQREEPGANKARALGRWLNSGALPQTCPQDDSRKQLPREKE